ncbi:MAG: ATP-binding cassette domain-containing protein [Alphaproteobacteria bacterium]
MLELDGVQVTIHSVKILHGVSLAIEDGELVGLIGRNGAGKTTTMRSIVGLERLADGEVWFRGERMGGTDAYRRAHMGIGYMPEDRRLVPQLTVEENILLPSWANDKLEPVAGLKFAYELMPELEAMRQRKALLLSGGQQKMVALARALMAGTHLLLLDEPFEGVAPALAKRLSEVIASLRQSKRSVLIAQSQLTHSSTLLDREYVIERGRVLSEKDSAGEAAN